VNVIQKGYGQIKLADSQESLEGEITLHAEGWVAFSPLPRSEDDEPRWIPNARVLEVIWKKSLAVRRPKP
jgi:hypothetical protein